MENNSIDKDKPIFPICVMAEALSMHPRTLRIYDSEKILSPQRSLKNRRLYSINDVEKGRFIQHLIRDKGVNLAGIKIILGIFSLLKISPEKYAKIITTV